MLQIIQKQLDVSTALSTALSMGVMWDRNEVKEEEKEEYMKSLGHLSHPETTHLHLNNNNNTTTDAGQSACGYQTGKTRDCD